VRGRHNFGAVRADQGLTSIYLRSRGLVVLLFDLPLELPHCLSVSPHNAKSRVPLDPSRRPRILQFTQFTQFTQFLINGSMLPMCKSREKN
jgi:hypothetical protein